MKVAVVSFAHERAATCVRLLRGMTGVKLLTADPGAPPDDPIRGRGVARELDVPHVDDWDEVFGWRPDAVLITSEVAHRRTLAERAAEIGARPGAVRASPGRDGSRRRSRGARVRGCGSAAGAGVPRLFQSDVRWPTSSIGRR